MTRVLKDETALVYFREQVVAAMQRQKVETSATLLGVLFGREDQRLRQCKHRISRPGRRARSR